MTEETTSPMGKQKNDKKKLLVGLLVIILVIPIGYLIYTSYPKYFPTPISSNAKELLNDPQYEQQLDIKFVDNNTQEVISWKKVKIYIQRGRTCPTGNCNDDLFFSGRTNKVGQIDINLKRWNAINGSIKSNFRPVLYIELQGYNDRKIIYHPNHDVLEKTTIHPETSEIELKFNKQ